MKLPGRFAVWFWLACWGAVLGAICGAALVKWLGLVILLVGAGGGFVLVLMIGGVMCSVPDEKDS